jgi:hypothetical protein
MYIHIAFKSSQVSSLHSFCVRISLLYVMEREQNTWSLHEVVQRLSECVWWGLRGVRECEQLQGTREGEGGGEGYLLVLIKFPNKLKVECVRVQQVRKGPRVNVAGAPPRGA